MAFEVDSSKFPLIMVRWAGRADAANFTAFFDALSALHERARVESVLLVTVHDARKSERPDAQARDVVAQRLKTTTLGKSLLDIVVTDSAPLRGVVTAMGWVAPGPMAKVKAVKDMDAAMALARDAFQAAGFPVPERPRWAV